LRSVNFKCIALNNRFYIVENLTPSNKLPIKVLDPALRMIVPITLCPNTAADGPPNMPSSTRFNYAIAECNNKIFMYGGLNEKQELLGCCDMFDCCTYKFTPVKYRGDYTPKGR
jgi:hypothetical protein